MKSEADKLEIHPHGGFISLRLIPESEEEKKLLEKWQYIKAYPQHQTNPPELHVYFFEREGDEQS